MSEQLTKTTGELIAAVGAHVRVLVDSGLVEPDKLRLTIEARKEKAKELIDSGLSQRQAAAVLGVSKSTLNADLSENRTKSVQKPDASPTPEPMLFEPDPEQEAKAAEKRARDERRQLRWAATLNLLSVAATLDREPAYAAEVVALYDRKVEQEKGEELTKERLQQCAAFLAALIDAWEDEQ